MQDSLNELQQAYLNMSKEMVTILYDIKMHWEDYPDYLGWLDLNSPLIPNPDILVIRINPGPGRFILYNRDNWDYHRKVLLDPQKKKLPEDFPTLWRNHLQWLLPNNARKGGEWWNDTKPKFNHFPYYMCELLVRIYRHEYPANSYPRKALTDIFEQRIMATNLYPMATQDLGGLNRLIETYKKQNGMDIREICHTRLSKLIELVKPHCIVFLGDTVRNELSACKLQIPSYCISRKYRWHSKDNIKTIAEDIYKQIKA